MFFSFASSELSELTISEFFPDCKFRLTELPERALVDAILPLKIGSASREMLSSKRYRTEFNGSRIKKLICIRGTDPL